jgi:hypothetical protein
MAGSFRFVVIPALNVALATAVAFGNGVQPGLNKALRKCESGNTSALSKFVGAKVTCISKCIANARKDGHAFTGCLAPFADPKTNGCIIDGSKGAEAKAASAIAKVCSPVGSCPQCYLDNGESGCADTSPANRWVQIKEGEVDLLTPYVYCYELVTGLVPPKPLAKCEDGVAKALVKFVGAKTKCYQKCYANIAKGKIPPGTCDPPSPLDPATNACDLGPKGASAKAAASIDKACFIPPAVAPDCFDGYDSGPAWAQSFEDYENQLVRFVNCGSPSGAFLQ